MNIARIASLLAISWSAASCLPAGSPPEAKSPTSSERDEPSTESEPDDKPIATQELPKDCKQQGKLCAPPDDFVQRLCGSKFPGLAIVWFAKGTPWTRQYVRQQAVEPRNTTGGPSSETKLTWGEEVLVLKQHGGGGNIKVSGAVDYDVLRWDGTCASMSDLEMTPHAPGMPKNAPIVWRYLDSNVQDALLKDAAIQKAQEAETKACGGKAAGAGFDCEQAGRNLNTAIVSATRKGIELPTPERLP